MRKSLREIAHMVKETNYGKPFPIALIPLYTYVLDSGHSIMCVPEMFVEDAIKKGCCMYEIPLPVRYVLEKGWKQIPGTDSICVNVPYDPMISAIVPDGYEEY